MHRDVLMKNVNIYPLLKHQAPE